MGQLLFISHDRMDIQLATKEVAEAMAHPIVADEARVRRIVRYLRDRPSMLLYFEIGGSMPERISVTVDADWGSDASSRRSTSGGMLQIGSALLLSWSRTQHSVSLSSCESE